MGVDDVLGQKRADILRIAERHGVTRICVFGSMARGEARPDSDVDFLIETGSKRTPFFPGGLVADLEELLGRHVDVVTERGLHWFVRDRILKEAVPL
jgi:hypothetical protein